MDDFNRVKDEWRAGDIRLLLAHPASTGHGVDGLQGGGHTLVWFGLNWSLELTLQFNGRLHRQGQEHPVMCHRILANNTMDQAVNIALSMKENTQSDLRDAVRLYRQQRGM
jgi:SNF2 family DNA or RNA helicase